MKLSASKWLAFLGALTSRNVQQTGEPSTTGTSVQQSLQARDVTTYRLHISTDIPYPVTLTQEGGVVVSTATAHWNTDYTTTGTGSVLIGHLVDANTVHVQASLTGELIPLATGTSDESTTDLIRISSEVVFPATTFTRGTEIVTEDVLTITVTTDMSDNGDNSVTLAIPVGTTELATLVGTPLATETAVPSPAATPTVALTAPMTATSSTTAVATAGTTVSH